MDEIIEIVRRIVGIEGLGPDTALDEAGFTSMNVVELLVELESLYGITIPDEEFLATRTLRELHALVSPLREAAAQRAQSEQVNRELYALVNPLREGQLV